MPKTNFLRIFAILLLSPLLAAAKPDYFQATALSGDGVYSLLRRYELDQHSCNFEQFYGLNNLKRNAHLVVGRKYFLPVMVYAFNGKTIRSSIGTSSSRPEISESLTVQAVTSPAQRNRMTTSSKSCSGGGGRAGSCSVVPTSSDNSLGKRYSTI